jgi:hypothetical protein
MTIRGIIWAVLLCVAGVISIGVSLHGVWSVLSIDLKQDTILSCVYCVLPILCFPVLLLVRPQSRSAIILSLMAITYLGAYSVLNWRTCSELGYCESIMATVMQTLSTNTVLGFFAVVILSLVAMLIDDHSTFWSARS